MRASPCPALPPPQKKTNVRPAPCPPPLPPGRPGPAPSRQRWIAFQLLHAAAQCHERGICHGDIKSENVLMTSWQWAVLADWAPFKPVHLPADNPVRVARV